MTPIEAARQAIELREKATPGEWKDATSEGRAFVLSNGVRHVNASGGFHDVAYLCTSNGCDENDAAFIAHAANTYAAVAEALIEARTALAKIGHKMAFSSIDDTQGTHQRMDDIRKVARKIVGEPQI